MIVERFEHLLKQAAGLDAASIGTFTIERAVQARVQACGVEDAELYWAHVNASPDELQALVEAVVVPETWFFRDRQAFAAMAQLAREQWLACYPDGPALRLLSLPCSTGEEPYTMAMALLEAGFPPESFCIDAIDISRPALDHAQAGVYGRNSFRGSDLAYRDRHFTKTRHGYQLADAVRAQVRFRQGNLFEAGPGGGQFYDIVFCRNVLIYFDAPDQHRAIGILRRLLAPAGILYVGHSEASLPLGQGFASARIPFAFAFRKAAPGTTRATSAKPKPLWPEPRYRTAPLSRPAPLAKPERGPIMVPSQLSPDAALCEIMRCAGSGDLDGAITRGRAYLRTNPATAEALHLLGVVNDAAGDSGAAAEHYRKALYLDPVHEEALTHLALLLDKQGDPAGARRMRDRAQRLRERNGA